MLHENIVPLDNSLALGQRQVSHWHWPRALPTQPTTKAQKDGLRLKREHAFLHFEPSNSFTLQPNGIHAPWLDIQGLGEESHRWTGSSLSPMLQDFSADDKHSTQCSELFKSFSPLLPWGLLTSCHGRSPLTFPSPPSTSAVVPMITAGVTSERDPQDQGYWPWLL